MTPTQCKMARAALGWTVLELASRAGANKNTIVNFEGGKDAYRSTVENLKVALESTGKIRFEGESCVCVEDSPAVI